MPIHHPKGEDMANISIDNSVYVLAALNIASFMLGYLWCKSTIVGQVEDKPASFFKNNSLQKTAAPSKIEIDSTKFIVDIKTDNLQKKFDNLGETKQSEENIQSSVNKLKNMKK